MSGPAVLIVEDDANLREALLDSLNASQHPVIAAGSGPEALDIIDRQPIGLVVSDLQMQPMDGETLLREIRRQHPSLPAVLMTAYGSIENAVEAMRKGAADYLVKPFRADELRAIVDRYLKSSPDDDQPVAADPKSIELLRIASRVANTDATITISGESGSGKEVIARYVHACSRRRDKPFVAINCAAIPENMLEAVLFGYEKGAFTGASAAHAGKFEQADGGTLLLDEVSEMALGLQAKLLRVIQEREVERLGGRNVVSLDVRVLATTNRDLRQYVADGRFREDLYYRLNVFPLQIPALRMRTGDIVPLANLAIGKHSDHGRPTPVLDACAERKLMAHDWPGNVRELENLMQRSLILLQGDTITAADLAFEEVGQAPDSSVEAHLLHDDLRHREYELVLEAMQKHGGNRGAVAAALGISPRTLRYKLARMRELGVT